MQRFIEQSKLVFRFFLKYKFRIICFILVLAVLCSARHYFSANQTASATLSLNYAEASDGLNPNKTRFNASEFVSEQVMKDAIDLLGLQDCLTPDELAGCISVSPVDTGNVGGNDRYISTTYRVSFNAASIDIKNRRVTDVLINVCSAYKNYFLRNYCDNQNIARIELSESDKAEPFVRVNELKLRVNQINRYNENRLSENKSFVQESTGNSFMVLDKKIKNVIDYDIPNTMAYIIEGGVARNSQTLLQILEYKNKIMGISSAKEMAAYDADNNGIRIYDREMSSVVMIPTRDGMEQYYMSRTKTAMDHMAIDADSSLKEATDYKKTISETQYVIDQVKTDAAPADKLKYTDELIAGLEKSINEISAELLSLDEAYVSYKSQNYITFHFSTPSFSQKLALKNTAMEVLGIVAVLYLLMVFRMKRKEEIER